MIITDEILVNEFWNQIDEVLSRSIENSSRSIFDDFIKENAKNRANAGISTKIVRKLRGETCEWCKSIAGVYEYGEEPAEVYRRHDNCDCTVEYFCEKGRQNVWDSNEKFIKENDYKKKERISYMMSSGNSKKDYYKIAEELSGPKFSSETDFKQKLKEKFDVISSFERDIPKEEWETILSSYGFSDNYLITKTPSILSNFGVVNKNIFISKSDLAYIFSRHNRDFKLNDFFNLSEVINDYDILWHGRNADYSDFKFYKLYNKGTDDVYGLEIAIEKRKNRDLPGESYIVHFNRFGKRKHKAEKKIKQVINKENVIDMKYN